MSVYEMKLALGSVQFGIPYGVANKGGQVSSGEVADILSVARESSIDLLDTAIAYGDSEACLGEIGTKGFKIITKLPALPEGVFDIGVWLDKQIRASLRRLRVDSIYGLLLHQSQQLVGSTSHLMMRALEQLKVEGVVEKIGISIYTPHELDEVIRNYTIDLVQAPLNVVDQRLVTSGWLQRLYDLGIEIHTRSTFLQGLLLIPRTEIPVKFERWAHLWDAWHDVLQCNNLAATTACLWYPLNLPQVNRVVVGVDSVVQLRELIAVTQSPPILMDCSTLACDDESLINPTQWSLL
jgi:aryl-alcohol dehydrogenase-like predicted oxidoreductase